MVRKLARNGRHWVVIQYSHSASPLRFGNKSLNLRSRQPRPIGPRCQAPLFPHHNASLLQLRPADSLAQALESGRRTQLAGSTLPVLNLCFEHITGVVAPDKHFESALQPQRVGPVLSGPLWRGCAILLIRLRNLLRPALGSAAASPAKGRTCLRSASSAYVCLRQSMCTPIRLQPTRAAKEPPRGDRQMGPPFRMYRRLDTNKRETNKSPAASLRSPPAWNEGLNQVIQSTTVTAFIQPTKKSERRPASPQKPASCPLRFPILACLGSKTAISMSGKFSLSWTLQKKTNHLRTAACLRASMTVRAHSETYM